MEAPRFGSRCAHCHAYVNGPSVKSIGPIPATTPVVDLSDFRGRRLITNIVTTIKIQGETAASFDAWRTLNPRTGTREGLEYHWTSVWVRRMPS